MTLNVQQCPSGSIKGHLILLIRREFLGESVLVWGTDVRIHAAGRYIVTGHFHLLTLYPLLNMHTLNQHKHIYFESAANQVARSAGRGVFVSAADRLTDGCM